MQRLMVLSCLLAVGAAGCAGTCHTRYSACVPDACGCGAPPVVYEQPCQTCHKCKKSRKSVWSTWFAGWDGGSCSSCGCGGSADFGFPGGGEGGCNCGHNHADMGAFSAPPMEPVPSPSPQTFQQNFAPAPTPMPTPAPMPQYSPNPPPAPPMTPEPKAMSFASPLGVETTSGEYYNPRANSLVPPQTLEAPATMTAPVQAAPLQTAPGQAPALWMPANVQPGA